MNLVTGRRLSGLAGGVVWLLRGPVPAWACPTCYGSSASRVLDSYYVSTVMLSLLPFAVVGSILLVALYVRRQAHAGEAIATAASAHNASPLQGEFAPTLPTR